MASTKQAATCPTCGNTRDFDGVEPDDPAYRCCPDEFHSAHPVSAEPWTVCELSDGRITTNCYAPSRCGHEQITVVPEARAAEAERERVEAIGEFERRAKIAADARDPRARHGDPRDAVLLAREQENRAAADYLRSLTPKHPQDEGNQNDPERPNN